MVKFWYQNDIYASYLQDLIFLRSDFSGNYLYIQRFA